MKSTYRVITLCGSTKFKDDFIRVQKELTLKGCIVLSVGLFGHADDEFKKTITPEIKEMLDDIHKRKIDMSDGIYVINKDGYIGESTRSEIEYARKAGKLITYMEDPKHLNQSIIDLKIKCFLCKNDIVSNEDWAGSNFGMIGEMIGRNGMIHRESLGSARHYCRMCCPGDLPEPEIIKGDVLLRELLILIEKHRGE